MRIYQNIPLQSGSEAILDPQASHHLARVLRAKIGDELTLFNGLGGEYAASIVDITKKAVTVAIGRHDTRERESPIDLYLAQGMAKGEKMDFIVQKAVELGVKKIFPLITERVNVQLKGEREVKRLQHWEGVVVSACEQSGRTRIPEVLAPRGYEEFLRNETADYRFVLTPHLAGNRVGKVIQRGKSVLLLIGPEGGFSEAEETAAIEAGYRPMNLGPRILRTETATIAALAILSVSDEAIPPV